MRYITSLEDGADLFKALGSDIRIKILNLIRTHRGLSLNELAAKLQVTNGALTGHIRKLEQCGLIGFSSEESGHGNRKICSVQLDKILIDLEGQQSPDNVYTADIRVGHYSDFHVYPTCGLATADHLIGEVDDPRYFAHPERYNADIVWFTRGYVEYIVPHFIPEGSQVDQITFSFELGSEAPGINERWPSDITFSLNGRDVAVYTSPGDFGHIKGILTPSWWYPNWNQYGLLRTLTLNHEGTFIDGMRVSEAIITDFDFGRESLMHLRLSVRDDAAHIGGLTVFGKGFGNYDQDIRVQIYYS